MKLRNALASVTGKVVSGLFGTAITINFREVKLKENVHFRAIDLDLPIQR